MIRKEMQRYESFARLVMTFCTRPASVRNASECKKGAKGDISFRRTS